MTSVQILTPASVPTKGKEKPKEVWFDHVLKKPSGQGLGTPFRFDILAQLANIPARITIHELLRLSKETREALRDALANLESFLTYMPGIPKDDAQSSCPECHHYNQTYLLLPSQRKICFSRIISTIDFCTTPDTSVQHALNGYRLIRGLHSASSPKGSTSSVYHYIGCPQPLLQYTISMPAVVIHLGKFDSVAESGA